jgi:hypothetical protein
VVVEEGAGVDVDAAALRPVVGWATLPQLLSAVVENQRAAVAERPWSPTAQHVLLQYLLGHRRAAQLKHRTSRCCCSPTRPAPTT